MQKKVRGARNTALHQSHAALFAAFFLCLSSLLLSGCAASQPILIGFTAELSGRNAALGVQSRNGAALAVEEINARGGIAGRPVDLVVRDNQGSPERVPLLDQELIDNGVVVLTGHNTSWESVAARPIIDARSAVLFSPTAASPLFDGRDDYFFRMIPTNREQARPMADYAYGNLNVRRIALLDDDDNLFYSHPYVQAFLERFTALGGQSVNHLHFSSKARPDFRELIEKLRASQAEGLLVIASDTDTALIAQQIRLAGWDVQLLASNWAFGSSLIQNGGRAVEGMILPSHFDTTCQEPAFLRFREKFLENYGEEPAFSAALSYESIQVVAQALERTGGQLEGLTTALTSVRDFGGLCGKISLDENGDARRSLVLMQIQEGQYQMIQALSPEDTP